MTAKGLWLQKQCILLAKYNGGSPLDWVDVPLCQLGGWIQATNDLNGKQPQKAPEKIPPNDAGAKVRELFGLPENG